MTDYLSLVANSGQVNTPPGSYNTVKEWIHHSFLGPHARVLEVGCSTGFITIEIARYTGAESCGVDRHLESIEAAKRNIDPHIADRVSFVEGDAGQLSGVGRAYSHVIVGGHLPFVPPNVRRQHVGEAASVLKPWGYVLTAMYFYRSPPPQSLLDRFNREIGTKLGPEGDYAYWTGLFENQSLQLEYESVHEVEPASSERMREYLDHLEPASRVKWEHRLKLFNENGSYLNYFVRVYRKLPKHDNLMLQTPRGGIYRSKLISQRSC